MIVAGGSPAIRAAQKATTTIPIIMSGTGDPVASGLVQSLARAGGNTTGVSEVATAMTTKHLELMREVMPSVSRVGLLANPGSSTRGAHLNSLGGAAQQLEVGLLVTNASSSEEIERGIAVLKDRGAEAVLILPDSLFISRVVLIASLAATHRVPSIFALREFAEAGGMMSYGTNREESFRSTVTFIDKMGLDASWRRLLAPQPCAR